MMKQIAPHYLLFLTTLLIKPLAALGASEAVRSQKPNILVLLADDLGYQDLSCQGSPEIKTPHIDSLAKNGLRCSNGYVTAVMCSPSRAGLLTGRSQSRFGHEINWPDNDFTGVCGLPLTEKTIADRLKTAGYRTGCIGKWHLGDVPKFHPNKRGFDEFFGFLNGGHKYFCEKYTPAQKHGYTEDIFETYTTQLQRNGAPENHTGYLTTVLGREAASFIRRNKDQPWFLYMAFNAPHTPFEAPQEYLDRYAAISDPTRRTYAAMVGALDDAVGHILDQLRTEGLEQNTLIFFLSDNGGPSSHGGPRNHPLSGEKGFTLEGGVRVPFLVQWKGVLPADKIYDRPVSSLDIAASTIDLAGIPRPKDLPLDGTNLMPYLTGGRTDEPHAALFWRLKKRKTWAVRVGDWKLEANWAWHDIPDGTRKPRLINLRDDLGERQDLSAESADKVAELQATYDHWKADLPEPLW
jgi:arylsulfatase A-like enzyme